MLADQADGDDTLFREVNEGQGASSVVAVSPRLTVYASETVLAIPPRTADRGRPPSVPHPDRPPVAVETIARSLPPDVWQTLPCRQTAEGVIVTSRFACLRVFAAHTIARHQKAPRREWLIIEWPPSEAAPVDYWLANLAASTIPEQLAGLARLRWTIELDDRQLKGEPGLDHDEGRSWKGWHHHTALVTCAHAFITEQRLRPRPARPA